MRRCLSGTAAGFANYYNKQQVKSFKVRSGTAATTMRPAAAAMRIALGLVAVLALLATTALATATTGSAAAPQQTFSQAITRAIDLTSQLVRETATINIDNTGATPLERYELRTPDAAHLAYVGVKTKASAELPLTVLQTGAAGAEAWEVQLVPPVPPGEKVSMVATFVYINKMVPLPAHAPLLAPQKMRLDHTLHFYSPYHTHKERTTVTVPSGPGVVSKTENTVAVDGNKLTYGPFTDIAPLDRTELFVHFENNAPFAAVTSLVRTLEVSHWGNNLAVEEFFDVEHKGSKLEGQFSRLELMRAGIGAVARSNIVQSFTLQLPGAAADIYYRDVIGNISTSTVRPNVAKGVINLTLEPRYPLVGGWKTKWYHGWNQPLSTALHHRQDAPGYVLEIPLATLFENAAVEKFELRVTLPEGAQNVELHAAVPLDDIHLERTTTYLDITGRPVLVARRQRLVNEHNGIVYVRARTRPRRARASRARPLNQVVGSGDCGWE